MLSHEDDFDQNHDSAAAKKPAGKSLVTTLKRLQCSSRAQDDNGHDKQVVRQKQRQEQHLSDVQHKQAATFDKVTWVVEEPLLWTEEPVALQDVIGKPPSPPRAPAAAAADSGTDDDSLEHNNPPLLFVPTSYSSSNMDDDSSMSSGLPFGESTSLSLTEYPSTDSDGSGRIGIQPFVVPPQGGIVGNTTSTRGYDVTALNPFVLVGKRTAFMKDSEESSNVSDAGSRRSPAKKLHTPSIILRGKARAELDEMTSASSKVTTPIASNRTDASRNEQVESPRRVTFSAQLARELVEPPLETSFSLTVDPSVESSFIDSSFDSSIMFLATDSLDDDEIDIVANHARGVAPVKLDMQTSQSESVESSVEEWRENKLCVQPSMSVESVDSEWRSNMGVQPSKSEKSVDRAWRTHRTGDESSKKKESTPVSPYRQSPYLGYATGLSQSNSSMGIAESRSLEEERILLTKSSASSKIQELIGRFEKHDFTETLEPEPVQEVKATKVSLEGPRDTHDRIDSLSSFSGSVEIASFKAQPRPPVPAVRSFFWRSHPRGESTATSKAPYSIMLKGAHQDTQLGDTSASTDADDDYTLEVDPAAPMEPAIYDVPVLQTSSSVERRFL